MQSLAWTTQVDHWFAISNCYNTCTDYIQPTSLRVVDIFAAFYAFVHPQAILCSTFSAISSFVFSTRAMFNVQLALPRVPSTSAAQSHRHR